MALEARPECGRGPCRLLTSPKPRQINVSLIVNVLHIIYMTYMWGIEHSHNYFSVTDTQAAIDTSKQSLRDICCNVFTLLAFDVSSVTVVTFIRVYYHYKYRSTWIWKKMLSDAETEKWQVPFSNKLEKYHPWNRVNCVPQKHLLHLHEEEEEEEASVSLRAHVTSGCAVLRTEPATCHMPLCAFGASVDR